MTDDDDGSRRYDDGEGGDMIVEENYDEDDDHGDHDSEGKQDHCEETDLVNTQSGDDQDTFLAVLKRLQCGIPDEISREDCESHDDKDDYCPSTNDLEIQRQLEPWENVNVSQMAEMLRKMSTTNEVSDWKQKVASLMEEIRRTVMEHQNLCEENDQLRNDVKSLTAKLRIKNDISLKMKETIDRLQPIINIAIEMSEDPAMPASPPSRRGGISRSRQVIYDSESDPQERNHVTPSRKKSRRNRRKKKTNAVPNSDKGDSNATLIEQSQKPSLDVDDDQESFTSSDDSSPAVRLNFETQKASNKTKNQAVVTHSRPRREEKKRSGNYNGNVTIPTMWKILKERGWQHIAGPKPFDMVYVPPGGTTRLDAVLGKDFFDTVGVWKRANELGLLSKEEDGQRCEAEVSVSDATSDEAEFVDSDEENKTSETKKGYDEEDLDNEELRGPSKVLTERSMRKCTRLVLTFVEKGEGFMHNLFTPIWECLKNEQAEIVKNNAWKNVNSPGLQACILLFQPPYSKGINGQFGVDYFTSERLVAFLLRELELEGGTVDQFSLQLSSTIKNSETYSDASSQVTTPSGRPRRKRKATSPEPTKKAKSKRRRASLKATRRVATTSPKNSDHTQSKVAQKTTKEHSSKHAETKSPEPKSLLRDPSQSKHSKTISHHETPPPMSQERMEGAQIPTNLGTKTTATTASVVANDIQTGSEADVNPESIVTGEGVKELLEMRDEKLKAEKARRDRFTPIPSSTSRKETTRTVPSSSPKKSDGNDVSAYHITQSEEDATSISSRRSHAYSGASSSRRQNNGSI